MKTPMKFEMLQTMLIVRAFENRVKKLYMEGVIRGTVHLSTGMEGVSVGACMALRPDDYITSTHRGHGHCIAKGVALKPMLAEVLGRATGLCGGRGGTMHLFDVPRGVMGTIGVVGGGIPVATGIGVGIQQLGQSRVVLCFMGDGATNQGAFHEALNLGSTWKLPVLYLIENNLVGDTTPLKEVVNIEDLADRAGAYGIPGVVVDGNDVLAVHRAVEEAASRARGGEGPTLLECKTYRWEGHHLGDPCVYRTREEVDEWRRRCPIKRFAQALIDDQSLTSEALGALEKEAEARLDEAEEYALGSPEPSPDTVLEYV